MKRATFFKSSSSSGPSSPEQAKPSRQSIRGRISAPIPIHDTLAPPPANELPLGAPIIQPPAPTQAPPPAPSPEPVPVQEAAIPESKPPMPASPPPPTRASPPPPVVSAFSEDLDDSDASDDEAAGEEADISAEAPTEAEAGASAEAVPETEAAEPEEAKAGEVIEAAEPEEAVPEPTKDNADHEDDVEEEGAAEPLPPLQSPKTRASPAYLIGHRRIPTAERPQELQQPQLPLPEPPASPPSQSQPHLQYQLPQNQQGPFRQAVQQAPGPSPPPLSAGTSAISSARASGTASAANSASSPAFRHRTNPSSTLRYSGASGLSSSGVGTSAGNTVSGSPKRKKSTLRGAFSKLFSRRKKTDSQILPPIAADPDHDLHDDDMGASEQALHQQQHQQYQQQQLQQQQQQQAPQHRSVRSDPTVLGRPRDSEPKRSASLPITEYDRALRSHSIGPEDILAIESARSSFQTDRAQGSSTGGLVDANRRRAATSTNRTFFPPVSQGNRRRFINKSDGYANILGSSSGWTGLSPRPASAQGRKSQNRLSGSDIVSGGAGGGFARNWAAGLGGSGGPGSAGLGAGFNLFGGAGSRNVSGATPDPNEIGRAITSNGRDSLDVNNDLSSRRRSRSLSNLHALSFDQGQARGRSDEIRYWRESYDPAFLSPLSSNHDMSHDQDDDVEEGREGGNQAQANRGNQAGGFPGGEDDLTGTMSLLQSLPDSPIDSPIDQDDERQKGKHQAPKTPPQPFPFGNLSNLGGVSGSMKIPPANSMDSRIGGLETRMHRMERVVDQLCHTVPGYKEPAANAAGPDNIPRSVPPFPDDFSGQPAIPPIPAIYQAQAATPFGATASSSRYSNSRHSAHSNDSFESDLAHSHMSFGDGQTYIGSLHPPSSSATQAHPGATLAPGDGTNSPALRPTSTSTVRGATSMPAMNASVSNDATAELMAQLESERAVRQTLETQVKKLNERVNALSTTMYAMLRDPAAAKPRGSPLVSAPSSNSLRGQSRAASAAAAATQLKAESVLQTAKALGHGNHGNPGGGSAFSADEETESDGGFQTPLEGHYNYNNFGDENNAANTSTTTTGSVDETKRKKKAARTLSLGQLTLGKSAVQT